MLVSLGCEKLQPVAHDCRERIAVLEEEPALRCCRMRSEGFGEMVANIMALAEKKLKKLNERRRVTCPAADLVVGLQCGGSDAFSGVTANPAVGFADGPAGAGRRDGDVF